MTGAAAALLVGLAALLLHVATATFLIRRCRGVQPVLLHAASAAIFVVVLGSTLVGLAALLGTALPFWPALSILYGGAIAFLFAFSAVYKSVSLQVLAALAAAPDGRLDHATIAQRVVLPLFVERIALLVAAGFVEIHGTGFAITAAGRAAGQRLRRIQAICGIRRGGLYASD
jgi:hypothetical protein